MNRRNRYILLSFALIALILGLFGFIIESSIMGCIAMAFGLALIALGLGISSYLNTLHIDRRMCEIDIKLSRIENLQTEIHKEQKEQASSHSPLTTSLQALSQYYLDYMTRKKEEGEKET